MDSLKYIPINAHIAWCPFSTHGNLIACGRREHGTNMIDIVDIKLNTIDFQNYNIPFHIETNSELLTSLAWSSHSVSSETQLGYIASGSNDGSIKIWNPYSYLLATNEPYTNDTNEVNNEKNNCGSGIVRSGLLSVSKSSDDSISCIQFHPERSMLLACGRASGSFNIVNLEDPCNPETYHLGPDVISSHSASNVTSLSWNPSVQHIVASTCSAGYTLIWSLRQKKASVKIKDPAGRVRLSNVSWIPTKATQLIVSYDDDTNPSLQMWDLRNTCYPFKEFAGHSKGILHIDFCKLDPSLMVTCGRDNRNICWSIHENSDNHSFLSFSEFSYNEWQSYALWSPCLPGLLASTSHMNSVSIESVQRRKNPYGSYVPSWEKKNTGVSFGFGGKLVHFSSSNPSAIQIDVVTTVDQEIIREADSFESTLYNQDYLSYCKKKIEESSDDHEILTWKAVETLLSCMDTKREAILACLGYDENSIIDSIKKYIKKKPLFVIPDNDSSNNNAVDSSNYPVITEDSAISKDNIRMHVNAEDFFNELDSAFEKSNLSLQSEDNTLKTEDATENYTTNSLQINPIYESTSNSHSNQDSDGSQWNTSPNILIKQSFILGQTYLMVNMCIEVNRWSDALLLAGSCGNTQIWNKVRESYINEISKDPFLKIVSCVLNNNFEELVTISDLTKWQETIAIIVSYSPFELFGPLCTQLGERLEKEMFDIRTAIICYLLAGNFKQVVRIWNTLSVSNKRDKSFQKCIQEFVERVAILKRVTNFITDDLTFIEKLSCYAEMLANSGRLIPAMKFLCLINDEDASKKSALTASINLKHRIYYSSPKTMELAGIDPPASLPFSLVNVESVMQKNNNYQQGYISENTRNLNIKPISDSHLLNESNQYHGMHDKSLVGKMNQSDKKYFQSALQQIVHKAPPSNMSVMNTIPMQSNLSHSLQPNDSRYNPDIGNQMTFPESLNTNMHNQGFNSKHTDDRFTSPISQYKLSQPPMVSYGSQRPEIPYHNENSLNDEPYKTSGPPPLSFSGMHSTPHAKCSNQLVPNISLPNNSLSVSPIAEESTCPISTQHLPHLTLSTKMGNYSNTSGQNLTTVPLGTRTPSIHSLQPNVYNHSQPIQQDNAHNLQPGIHPIHSSNYHHQINSQIGPHTAMPPIQSNNIRQTNLSTQDSSNQSHMSNLLHSSTVSQRNHSTVKSQEQTNYVSSVQPNYIPAHRGFDTSQTVPPLFSTNSLRYKAFPNENDPQHISHQPNLKQWSSVRPPDPNTNWNKSIVTLQSEDSQSEKSKHYPVSNIVHGSRINQYANENGVHSNSLNDGQTISNQYGDMYKNVNSNTHFSTAPSFGIASIPQGMPTPWPIPTQIQQSTITSKSTAAANQKINDLLNPQIVGCFMNENDLNYIRASINDVISKLKNENNPNGSQDESLYAKLQELIVQLEQGNIAKTDQDSIIQFFKAIGIRDMLSASRIQIHLSKTAWTKENSKWLLALKRLSSK